jgi:hypothetical protein
MLKDMQIEDLFKKMISRRSSGLYETTSGRKIPIYISEHDSLFDVGDIKKNIESTQKKSYSDTNIPKNYIRKKILPSLSSDRNLEKRYRNLKTYFNEGNILIIGAGDKIDYYKKLFEESLVVTSDVHAQFDPDIVFDAHDIPFNDASWTCYI